MDMRYHWLTDRVRQKQVDVYWRPGREISAIITQNIIQHNITKICEDLYFIRPIAFRFCEGVLNYSHSCNPGCAHAHTQRQIQAPREPLNLGV
jgi:hypothetical protein